MTPTSNNVIYRGYTDSSPYPPIKIEAPNKEYADILMDDFAGPKGEFTAMSLYFYLHYTAGENTGDYGETVSRIAIAEMHHMDMLGALIRKLGGNPVFRSSANPKSQYWYAKDVPYSLNLCESLHTALDGETNAIKTYIRHVELIKDPYIKNILERIIVDERLHRSYIYHMIEMNCK